MPDIFAHSAIADTTAADYSIGSGQKTLTLFLHLSSSIFSDFSFLTATWTFLSTSSISLLICLILFSALCKSDSLLASLRFLSSTDISWSAWTNSSLRLRKSLEIVVIHIKPYCTKHASVMALYQTV